MKQPIVILVLERKSADLRLLKVLLHIHWTECTLFEMEGVDLSVANVVAGAVKLML